MAPWGQPQQDLAGGNRLRGGAALLQWAKGWPQLFSKWLGEDSLPHPQAEGFRGQSCPVAPQAPAWLSRGMQDSAGAGLCTVSVPVSPVVLSPEHAQVCEKGRGSPGGLGRKSCASLGMSGCDPHSFAAFGVFEGENSSGFYHWSFFHSVAPHPFSPPPLSACHVSKLIVSEAAGVNQAVTAHVAGACRQGGEGLPAANICPHVHAPTLSGGH